MLGVLLLAADRIGDGDRDMTKNMYFRNLKNKTFSSKGRYGRIGFGHCAVWVFDTYTIQTYQNSKALQQLNHFRVT